MPINLEFIEQLERRQIADFYRLSQSPSPLQNKIIFSSNILNDGLGDLGLFELFLKYFHLFVQKSDQQNVVILIFWQNPRTDPLWGQTLPPILDPENTPLILLTANRNAESILRLIGTNGFCLFAHSADHNLSPVCNLMLVASKKFISISTNVFRILAQRASGYSPNGSESKRLFHLSEMSLNLDSSHSSLESNPTQIRVCNIGFEHGLLISDERKSTGVFEKFQDLFSRPPVGRFERYLASLRTRVTFSSSTELYLIPAYFSSGPSFVNFVNIFFVILGEITLLKNQQFNPQKKGCTFVINLDSKQKIRYYVEKILLLFSNENFLSIIGKTKLPFTRLIQETDESLICNLQNFKIIRILFTCHNFSHSEYLKFYAYAATQKPINFSIVSADGSLSEALCYGLIPLLGGDRLKSKIVIVSETLFRFLGGTKNPLVDILRIFVSLCDVEEAARSEITREVYQISRTQPEFSIPSTEKMENDSWNIILQNKYFFAGMQIMSDMANLVEMKRTVEFILKNSNARKLFDTQIIPFLRGLTN